MACARIDGSDRASSLAFALGTKRTRKHKTQIGEVGDQHEGNTGKKSEMTKREIPTLTEQDQPTSEPHL
jgi:hypothetical protein